MTAANRTAIVRRILPAAPSVVFEAWTDADVLAEFICPAPIHAGTVECDARVGGRLSIDMIDTEGVVEIRGEYLDVEPPHRLRFTWNSTLGDGFQSIVTVTLEPHQHQQTLMTIEHVQLPARWRDDHDRGWTSIARQLEARLRTRR